MTDKKHKQHKPEIVETLQGNVSTTEQPATGDQPQVEIEALMKRLEEAEAKVAEHLDDL